METMTVYVLWALFGSQPVMNADDGSVSMTAGDKQYIGVYYTLARCELDRKIIAETTFAKCEARTVAKK